MTIIMPAGKAYGIFFFGDGAMLIVIGIFTPAPTASPAWLKGLLTIDRLVVIFSSACFRLPWFDMVTTTIFLAPDSKVKLLGAGSINSEYSSALSSNIWTSAVGLEITRLLDVSCPALTEKSKEDGEACRPAASVGRGDIKNEIIIRAVNLFIVLC